jgi:hypothetical protein
VENSSIVRRDLSIIGRLSTSMTKTAKTTNDDRRTIDGKPTIDQRVFHWPIAVV